MREALLIFAVRASPIRCQPAAPDETWDRTVAPPGETHSRNAFVHRVQGFHDLARALSRHSEGADLGRTGRVAAGRWPE